MSKINVRSPYFVNLSTTNLVSAKLEIRIYVGAAETTWLGSPQYTLTSTAINEKVSFEIAELIKDYIPAAFNGVYPNDLDATEDYTTMYVDYRVHFMDMDILKKAQTLNYYKATYNQIQKY
jgi:hypothetical protein